MVEVTQADRDAAASVILTREVFDFLMGAGPLEGVEFGELHEGLPGRFWWRAVLRAAERETPAHRLVAIAEGRRQMREEAAKLTDHSYRAATRGTNFDLVNRQDISHIAAVLGYARALIDSDDLHNPVLDAAWYSGPLKEGFDDG